MSSTINGRLDYEDLFDNSPVGHIVAATDGTILALNATIENWTGIPRTELIEEHCCHRFPAEDYERLVADLSATGQAAGVAGQLVDRHGNHLPVVLSAARKAGADGGPELDHIVVTGPAPVPASGMQGQDRQTGRQVLEAARAEEEIRRNEALLRAVLDTVGVGVAVIDDAGKPLLQNAEFAAIVRHASPDNDGKADESKLLVFGPDGTTPVPPERRFLPRLSEGESFAGELIWIGPAGDRRALSVTGRPGSNEAFKGSVIAFDDITRLATALRAKDDFVAAVSHELRTPLTAVMGNLDLALDADLPPPLQRALRTAMRNSQRLLQLVTDLLSAASGTGEPEKQHVNLAEIITARVQAITPRAKDRDIRTLHDYPDRMPLHIDPQGIARVLDNLLSNALKFSQPGGQVTIRASQTGQATSINVTDTGAGMSQEEQREMFDRFFRSSTAVREAVPGAGLGLSIAKEIIDAHGGRITITSSPGNGSTFTVTLPNNY